MAPIDRRQHRQQRVRGAGPSSVQASFGFNFGAPVANIAKQSSLPPQRSSHRTPVLATPRGANGSAKRHRSASVQRSSAAKSARTPNGQTPSAALGKRKRGSSQARPAEEHNDDVDELSPERNDMVHSIEKSRRVVGTVSPIHEEVDDMPDELAVMETGTSAIRKPGLYAPISMTGTPASVVDNLSSRNGFVNETPILKRLSNGPGRSGRSTPKSSMRKSMSTKSRTATNGLRPSDAIIQTPSAVLRDEESEDELSPLNLVQNTPRVVAQSPYAHPATRDPDAMELDELSSPMPSVSVTDIMANGSNRAGRRPRQDSTPRTRVAPPKRSSLQQELEDEESPGTQLEEAQTTPAVRKSQRKAARGTVPDEPEAPEVDELSRQNRRVRRPQQGPNPPSRFEQIIEEEDGYESEYGEQAEEQEVEEPPQVVSARQPSTNTHPAEAGASKPSRKRQRISGPKHSIDVVRMKGMPLRGVTVADTTRTILEEILDKRINRAHAQMQSAHDSARCKDIRQQINLSISFKESLNEKLLDLQDSNDVLNINLQKLKLLKRDNVGLRKEILTLQSNRQDVALEHDSEQDVYEAEKSQREQRRALSTNMFDIEAAIRRGRERAMRDGREDEGPKMSSSMLLDVVGRQVGSLGGGLLKSATSFNTVLERAASWLEGRS